MLVELPVLVLRVDFELSLPLLVPRLLAILACIRIGVCSIAMPRALVPLLLTSLGVACAMRRSVLGLVPLRSDLIRPSTRPTGLVWLADLLGKEEAMLEEAGAGAGAGAALGFRFGLTVAGGAGAGTALGLRFDFNPDVTVARVELYDDEMLPDFVVPVICRSTPSSTVTSPFFVFKLGVAESLVGAARGIPPSNGMTAGDCRWSSL